MFSSSFSSKDIVIDIADEFAQINEQIDNEDIKNGIHIICEGEVMFQMVSFNSKE